jgi:hypothetical protein
MKSGRTQRASGILFVVVAGNKKGTAPVSGDRQTIAGQRRLCQHLNLDTLRRPAGCRPGNVTSVKLIGCHAVI